MLSTNDFPSMFVVGIAAALLPVAIGGCGPTNGGGTSSSSSSSSSSSGDAGGNGGSAGMGGSGGTGGAPAPTCTDAMKNGTETDVDCGGDACNPCANGLACSIADDCMSGSCIEGKCSACKLGSNLILNGGAEDGVAGVNHDDIVAIPSWTRTGNMTVLKYGSQASYPYPQTPGPTDRGMNVFIGGPSASTTLTQDVDLTACEDLILAGKVQMELSGWLGGLDSDPDYAQLSATFKDMTGADKGTTTIGPVTSADRMGLLSLLERTTTVDVPTEATKAVVTLQAVRSLGSYCNGYADNLSLMLLLK